MAVDFSDFSPSSTIPTSAYFVGYEKNESGGERKWTYGTLRSTLSGDIGSSKVKISDTPPSGASNGDLWFDSSSGITSIYYDSTWVDVGGGDAANSINVVDSPTVDLSWNSSTRTLSAVTTSMVVTSSSQMVAKAWVNFNGTGTTGTNQTIRSSYNVSSVTKNGTGDYTVNFATPMADANYVVLGTTGDWTTAEVARDISVSSTSPPTTSSVGIVALVGSGGGGTNPSRVSITIFGN